MSPADLATLVKTLTDAGGWTVSVALLTAFAGLFLTGRIVPGYLYVKEVARGDKAVEIGEKALEVSDKAVDGLTTLTAQQESMSKLLEGYIAGSRRP